MLCLFDVCQLGFSFASKPSLYLFLGACRMLSLIVSIVYTTSMLEVPNKSKLWVVVYHKPLEMVTGLLHCLLRCCTDAQPNLSYFHGSKGFPDK